MQPTTCPTCRKPLAGRGKCNSYTHKAIGLYRVGGRYIDKYFGHQLGAFTVTEIREERADWMGWSVTCVDEKDGRVRTHCTPYNYKNTVAL